jgi:hypothetical protein
MPLIIMSMDVLTIWRALEVAPFYPRVMIPIVSFYIRGRQPGSHCVPLQRTTLVLHHIC